MDTQERVLLKEALQILQGVDAAAATALEAQIAQVDSVAAMARSFPSMLIGDGKPSAPQSLVDTLCQTDAGMSSLSLPIRAVMGETYLTTKTQLFQALRLALLRNSTRVPEPVLEAADREVAQSLNTMLLGEILWDLVRDRALRLEVRQHAATQLVHLWESPDRLEIDDFFPVLDAVWWARNRVSVLYGSLIGVSEFFQLMREDCPPMFVTFFTRQDVSPEEQQAFQEFLFGLPIEELASLRDAMDKKGLKVLDRKAAEEILNHSSGSQPPERSPEALFTSYRRRHRVTQLRRLTHARGPRHTAESYLVLHLLEQPLELPHLAH